MTSSTDEYAAFVEHPRYGRGPHTTGLNPHTVYGVTAIHWHSPEECRIPHTAIPADLSRQTAATVPITHYFDVKRVCRDCGRPFIFFAEEQKHWYEELGFGLDSNCVRCVPCRKRQQGLALQRQRYEELFHVPNRTPDEDLEMADCCLSLTEASVFHGRQAERVRMLLNRVGAVNDRTLQARCQELRVRLAAIETSEPGEWTMVEETITSETVASVDWDEQQFKSCEFRDFTIDGGQVSSEFADCTFKEIDWYWGHFNCASFVKCVFTSCTFRGASFDDTKFVECEFTNCKFVKDNLGADCRFDGSVAYDCKVVNSPGFEFKRVDG